jgi:peptidoglycan LD-endopeptidase LytH
LGRLRYKGILLVGVLGFGACTNAPPKTAPIPVAAGTGSDTAYLRSRGLMVPVLGVYPDRVPDTFYAGRSGGRTHRASDIMAPRGTPVLSADSGRILRLDHNKLGGTTLFATDPGGRLVYYYAHLDRYEPTARAGAPLHKGEVIGYVGSTGDASPNAPHLHFQVMRYDDPRRWWDGAPIDAHAFFTIAGQDR